MQTQNKRYFYIYLIYLSLIYLKEGNCKIGGNNCLKLCSTLKNLFWVIFSKTLNQFLIIILV